MVIEERDSKPAAMNAFELISLSRGLNLSGLFETRGQVSNQISFDPYLLLQSDRSLKSGQ